MSNAPGAASVMLADLRAGVSRVADVLLALESSAELALLRDAAALRGRSAEFAAQAVAAADSLWPRYPLLTAAVAAVEEALDRGDLRRADALLGPAAITLEGGSTTSASALLASLERDAAEAGDAVQQVAAAWREAMPRLDAARDEVERLTAAAERLGLAGDADLATAQQIIEHLTSTIAVDPLAVDPSPAEAAVTRAATRIDGLARQRLGLPDRLAAADRQLEAIRVAIADAHVLLHRSLDRIVAPQGLLDPPDPTVVDGDERSLGPWLRRLHALAAAGDWRAATAGLDQWERVADGWQANADAAVVANRAPVRRRDELRGLMEAYRAKAAGIGRAEDLTLTEPNRAAREALQRHPCDLDDAAALVAAYRDAVNTVLAPTSAPTTAAIPTAPRTEDAP